MDYKSIIVWGAIVLIAVGIIWVFRRRGKNKRMASEGGYGYPAQMNYRYGDGPRNPQPQNYREEPKDEIRELRQEIRDRHKELTQLFRDFDYLLVSLQERENKNKVRDAVQEDYYEPREEQRRRGRPKKLNDYIV